MKYLCSGLLKWTCGGILLVAVLMAYPRSFEQPARAKASARRTDALIGTAFQVEVEGKWKGFFTTCTGVGSAHEIIENKAVGEKGAATLQKVPGRLRWHDVTLRRGLTSDMSLWAWRQEVVDGRVATARKKCTITAIGPDGNPQMIWELTNAWPSGLTMRAEGAAEAATEEMTITYEGMVRKQ